MRVLVIDDCGPYREALAQVLAAEPWATGVAMADDAPAALERLATFTPDVSLLNLATFDGVSIVKSLVAADPQAQVVAVGLAESEADVLTYAEAGVAGFVMRNSSLADLSEVVRSVARGESPCSPRVAATLLKRLAELGAEHNGNRMATTCLTAREREVLCQIEGGKSNKEIAGTLCIDVRTVKNHVHNILRKLQVHRRGEAVARARGPQWGTRSA